MLEMNGVSVSCVIAAHFIHRFYAFLHSSDHIITPMGCRALVGGLLLGLTA
jgi:hypothetical protein